MKLNVGCGNRRVPGYFGVDLQAGPAVDQVVDLTAHPWPFPDNSVESVIAWHFLEHLPGPELARAMDEIKRILVPGGEVYIRVPFKERGPYNPYHFHVFDSTTFRWWTAESEEGGPNVQSRHSFFRLRRQEVSWWACRRFPFWHIVRHAHWTRGLLFWEEDFGAYTWVPFAGPRELRVWLVKPDEGT